MVVGATDRLREHASGCRGPNWIWGARQGATSRVILNQQQQRHFSNKGRKATSVSNAPDFACAEPCGINLLLQDLRERYACVELKASLPLVAFRETVVSPGQV